MQKQNFTINKAKGEMTFENQQIEFFAFSWLKARRSSQKGQDSKSVKGRRSNCRHSASGQVEGNTKKTLDFFGDLVLAIKPLEKINANENTDTVHKTYQSLSDYLLLTEDLNLSFLPLYKYFTVILLATVNDAKSQQCQV